MLVDTDPMTACGGFGLFTTRRGPMQPLAGHVFDAKRDR